MFDFSPWVYVLASVAVLFLLLWQWPEKSSVMHKEKVCKTCERPFRAEPPTWRRQLNQSFLNPDGTFSPAKAIAVVAQVIILCQMNVHFSELVGKWDSLTVVLTFLVAPDVFKKFLNMKYGSTK